MYISNNAIPNNYCVIHARNVFLLTRHLKELELTSCTVPYLFNYVKIDAKISSAYSPMFCMKINDHTHEIKLYSVTLSITFSSIIKSALVIIYTAKHTCIFHCNKKYL